MEYSRDIYEFLYDKAQLSEEEVATIRPELDKIVLFKNNNSIVFVIDKIIEKGLYKDFKEKVDHHLGRTLKEACNEIEQEEAGVH